MKLSIIIPTYQSHDIRPLLSGLANQSKLPFEVIVVENGSHQKTLSQLAENESNLNIKYIHEPLAGLNRARNRGGYASEGSHIAIIDDDCLPHVDWVSSLMNAHLKNPLAGVIGGRVLLDYKAPPPVWLNSEFRRSLAELDYGEEQKTLGRWQHLVGANLSFSRDVFNEVGGFQESLGLKGDEEIIRANDEAEFIHKACLRGLPGAIYEGRAVVRHQIPDTRLTFDYLLRRRFGQGVSDIEYDLFHSGIDKAFRTFYNQVFRSRWHLEELKKDSAGFSKTDSEELLWRGMFARVLYLMGARERLVTLEPEYKVFSPKIKAEEMAFQRGKYLSQSVIGNNHLSINNLLQRVIYDPRIMFSPFARVALLTGIVNHELNVQLIEDVTGRELA